MCQPLKEVGTEIEESEIEEAEETIVQVRIIFVEFEGFRFHLECYDAVFDDYPDNRFDISYSMPESLLENFFSSDNVIIICSYCGDCCHEVTIREI